MQSNNSSGKYRFCQQRCLQQICLAFAAVIIALPVRVQAQTIPGATSQRAVVGVGEASRREASPLGNRHNNLDRKNLPTIKKLLAQAAPAPLNITGIKLNRGANGIEIVLETAGTIGTLTPQSIGNLRYFDIPNATITQPFQAANPAPGVANVSVTQISPSYVRVAVIGTNGAPQATVIASEAGATPPVAQTTEPELEINVTGSSLRDSYRKPNAASVTGTNTPIIETHSPCKSFPKRLFATGRVEMLKMRSVTLVALVIMGMPKVAVEARLAFVASLEWQLCGMDSGNLELVRDRLNQSPRLLI